jgi:N-acyl-L-homoserine lactone synthetase
MHQVLHSTSQGIPETVLGAMFVARKRVFVDLLKWDVPVLDGRFEVDQFDDVHAAYLVLADHGGAHLGSTRLLSTMRPHILGNLYPCLCDDGPPRGEGISEITRFCLDRSLNARDRRTVRDTLVSAIVLHALETGIHTYTAVAEMRWLQQILAFGWRCMPLGVPQAIDGALLAAVAIDVDEATPALIVEAGIRAFPCVLHADDRAAA